jgi:hypothetical protein
MTQKSSNKNNNAEKTAAATLPFLWPTFFSGYVKWMNKRKFLSLLCLIGKIFFYFISIVVNLKSFIDEKIREEWINNDSTGKLEHKNRKNVNDRGRRTFVFRLTAFVRSQRKIARDSLFCCLLLKVCCLIFVCCFTSDTTQIEFT